jgi:hypothetical protein
MIFLIFIIGYPPISYLMGIMKLFGLPWKPLKRTAMWRITIKIMYFWNERRNYYRRFRRPTVARSGDGRRRTVKRL